MPDPSLPHQRVSYRAFFERALEGLYRSTVEGRLIEANPAFVEMLGYDTRNELLSINLARDVYVDASDREAMLDLLRHEGKSEQGNVRLRKKDGAVIIAHDYIHGLFEDGRLVGMEGILTDVTEQYRAEEALRESEARYRMLVEQFPEPVIVHDGERIMYANPASAKFAGVASPEELIGRDIFGFSHPDSLAAAKDRIAKVVEKRKEMPMEEQKLIRPNGETAIMQVISRPVVFKGVQASQALMRDITEQRRYEQQLIESKERAEEMSNLKSAFLANMSHEVRTPLTGILGFAAILREELEDDKRELAEYIHQSGERLLETLNSVLDLARLEANVVTLSPEEIDLTREIKETAVIFRQTAAQKDIDIHVEAPEALTVYTDRTCLHRIVSNLLANAIKFTEEGDIYLSIAEEDDELLLRVRDTGEGINPRLMPYIFDEFKQGSTGLARQHQGSGLGLAITKRLVDRLQGEISVESEEGEGSTFTVRVPIQLEVEE